MIAEYKSLDEWYDAGLEYALKSWSCTFNRMGSNNLYKRIERITLGIVAELAFEQFLKDNHINYSIKGKTKWYEVDRYDIGIGDHAIDVKASIIDVETPKIARTYDELLSNPSEWLKDCTALVPEDQFNPGNNKKRSHQLKKKAYVFPFMYHTSGIFELAEERWIHAFWDYQWLKKAEHKDTRRIGHLLFKSDNLACIRVYGTRAKNDLVTEEITINSLSEKKSVVDFYQVFSVQWLLEEDPVSEIVITSENTDLKEVIEPSNDVCFRKNSDISVVNNWYSMRLAELNVVIPGWVDEIDMRSSGFSVPKYSKDIKQYKDTLVANFGIKVSDLNNMQSIKNLERRI